MNQSRLQGIYQRGSKIVYISFCPGNDAWYYQYLSLGTPAGTYSTMIKLRSLQLFLIIYDPVVITHLMPGTIVSDLYPELFI